MPINPTWIVQCWTTCGKFVNDKNVYSVRGYGWDNGKLVLDGMDGETIYIPSYQLVRVVVTPWKEA